jgi:hypothetical protein
MANGLSVDDFLLGLLIRHPIRRARRDKLADMAVDRAHCLEDSLLHFEPMNIGETLSLALVFGTELDGFSATPVDESNAQAENQANILGPHRKAYAMDIPAQTKPAVWGAVCGAIARRGAG